MEKYESVKQRMKDSIKFRIAECKRGYEFWKKANNKFEMQGCEGGIKILQNQLDNLDEITIIEIGKCTNRIIEVIQQAYLKNMWQYTNGSFEEFIHRHVTPIKDDGDISIRDRLARFECERIGIGLKDLLFFKGKDPTKEETVNQFLQIINEDYGVNIPMVGVEKQAQNELLNSIGKNEVESIENYLRARELARDSGSCGIPLEMDAYYQEMKRKRIGKSKQKI